MSNKEIGIWGIPNSGKTSYLSAAYIELEEKEKWNIEPQSKTPEASDLAIKWTKKIKQGQFPDPTDDAKELYFHFQREKILFFKEEFYLYLLDAPGGLAAENERASIGLLDLYKRYYDYLAQCGGLLVMVDPTGKNHYGDVKQLINELQQRDSVPLAAFCITKIDEHPQLWSIKEDGDAILKNVLEADLYELVKRYFRGSWGSRMKSFGVSIVGTRKVDEIEIPNIRTLPRLQKNEMATVNREPHNVLEPIKWLLEKTK